MKFSIQRFNLLTFQRSPLSRSCRATFVLALLTIFNFHLAAFAQGTLTPPGPPGATMLTLSQIQPRTPISSVPITITQPGSYYLTTNVVCTVSNAIVISVSGVSLDLNGFTISSTVANAANGGKAILLSGGLQNITIANGFIQGGVTNNGSGVYSGSGFAYGIFYSGVTPVNVLVSRLSVSGCLDGGIYLNLGDASVVESCTVRTTGSLGIDASTVRQSSVFDCGGDAIFGYQVSDCRGQSTGSGNGVFANSTARDCYGYSAGYIGVEAYIAQNCYGIGGSSNAGVLAHYSALNCYGSSNTGSGVAAETAENCCGSSLGVNTGINAGTAQNCYGTCTSGYGISADTAINCYGYGTGSAGSGISALTAQNCYGYSYAGYYGIYASAVASCCYGYCTSGTGLFAKIANVCTGGTSTGTALSTTHNVYSY
ncbi:MAG TPA: hypothetical protein VH280_08490 [Verrucomicrobiae bacterium]|nr:hypothetical protein [Verrucomicrobiae bacterium]